MADLAVKLGDINLDNPIIPASGTFGYGAEYKKFYNLNILGAISVKGTTGEQRFGNPQPRIAETPCGMLNAIGLQNPGIDSVLANELKVLRSHYKKPIILNISGFSLGEYASNCAKADKSSETDIIELNISCPNVEHGGLSFGADPESAAKAVRAARGATSKPLYVKLSPNVSDIVEMAKACEAEGADGLSLINTLLGMRIDIKRKTPILKNVSGGLSGPCVLPVALHMVYRVHRAVNLPIMGMGGISSAEDVLEMMLAGASAVQIGTANLKNPYICRDILNELPGLMSELGIESLSSVVGACD